MKLIVMELLDIKIFNLMNYKRVFIKILKKVNMKNDNKEKKIKSRNIEFGNEIFHLLDNFINIYIYFGKCIDHFLNSFNH